MFEVPIRNLDNTFRRVSRRRHPVEEDTAHSNNMPDRTRRSGKNQLSTRRIPDPEDRVYRLVKPGKNFIRRIAFPPQQLWSLSGILSSGKAGKMARLKSFQQPFNEKRKDDMPLSHRAVRLHEDLTYR